MIKFVLVRSVFLVVTSASIFGGLEVSLSGSEDLLGLINETSELV